MAKPLFLDFDGVIADSIEECFVISSQVYYGFTSATSDLNRSRHDLFYQHRGLVHPPWEYCALHRTIEKTLATGSADFSALFHTVKETMSQKEKTSFEHLFFSLRRHYQSDFATWSAMNPATEFGTFLSGRAVKHLYIVTTKNEDAVKNLLAHYRITVTDIFSHAHYNQYGCKGKLISAILDRHNLHEAIFIDDAVEHLDSVTDPRVQCYFADWGYGENNDYPLFHKQLWEGIA
ncbi:hypothetical protein JYU14_02435 [Simkania negevensis]|uniref:Uncharacterized protein n=1 Tax=Simkania negevensis TaxID=83561 RepID=A0ABS3ARF7_9BACT|nr:hypothetical protein [Simkania negevensis]